MRRAGLLTSTAAAKSTLSSECLGHFWRAEVGQFWKAPKSFSRVSALEAGRSRPANTNYLFPGEIGHPKNDHAPRPKGRDEDDRTSRCPRPGRDRAPSVAGGSGRIREWEAGSEPAGVRTARRRGARRPRQTGVIRTPGIRSHGESTGARRRIPRPPKRCECPLHSTNFPGTSRKISSARKVLISLALWVTNRPRRERPDPPVSH